MNTRQVPVPGPAAAVPCPWCDEPIIVDAAIDELRCEECSVVAAISPADDVPPLRALAA